MICKGLSNFVQTIRKADLKFKIYEWGCCSEPARKLGNEYFYQLFTRKNIEKSNEYKAEKIATVYLHRDIALLDINIHG